MEAPFHNTQIENQLVCSPTNDQNGFTDRQDSMEAVAMGKMALEENMSDSVFGINSSRPSSSGLTAIDTSDSEPSALVPDIQTAHIKTDVAEGKKIACTDEDSDHRNPVGHLEMVGHDCKALTTLKKEARFELRAFQEEKKPSKLFDCSSEKEPVRVKKVRDSEEMDELERERQELIHSQAVKKNPGIATKWWNPPQIKTIEEDLDPEQLESHRKYQERKQKKLESSNVQQELPAETDVSFILVENIKKEDLQIEATHELCSAGAEATHQEMSTWEKATEVKTQSVDDHPTDIGTEQARIENKLNERNEMQENCGDFTCAQTVVTLLEDLELSSANSSCHNEEIDSGLDELSVQSRDTAPQELLSNDLRMDNVSDSGTSNEATSSFLENSLGDFSLPATPQATSPVNGEMGGSAPQSESGMSPSYPGTSLTEEPTEHHAIQQAFESALTESPKESLPNPERDEEMHHETHVGESSESSNGKGFIQSPQTGGKQEFSYFSKYSDVAELRSTASMTRPRETEVSSGPFRLRSHKQRTLSRIEQEIRAAEEREQELKRQRQNTVASRKERTANIPTRLVVTAKTAPGKIHCVAFTQDCPSSPVLSDVSSDGSEASQRPKNFMQTLMDDYETHQVKRKEKMEDNRVLEATRVTRRQSNMAVRWEAGVYTNREEDEE
ncbi:A-kinase anchor protein 2-like [Conger conger]|uniref:A-kinase anchor protein 2-like n=1 Tax=Conger conger TaxID=82655 RepID=UPI002A5A0F07|nr:A-kinase anchor protein 2-like [Conger conger]